MPLSFGIPSLDDLLEVPESAAKASELTESYAILGPDGSGKSVFALHLASRYYADCVAAAGTIKTGPCVPAIIYVSSDLRHTSALRIWTNFNLGNPNLRHIPFERSLAAIDRQHNSSGQWPVQLTELRPSATTGENSLTEYLFARDKNSKAMVGFLDLASHTEGDDWNFVNALLSNLESIESPNVGKTKLPHLVIIDSVAGFETFIGKLDAYGVEQSRRARIAQCMRNSSNHCHIVFVVEEPKESEHLPEEFVTDVVVRLRNRITAASIQRSIAIEKARARKHAVGEHPFEIRSMDGTSTGAWENADTPRSRNAYVQIFPSIAHRNSIVGANPRELPPLEKDTVARFGIHYLDELLVPGTDVLGRPNSRGLRAGTATALIGDSSTGKTALAERFLAEGFRLMITNFIRLYAVHVCGQLPNSEGTPKAVRWLTSELARSIIPEKDNTQSDAGGAVDNLNAKDLERLNVEYLEEALRECQRKTEKRLAEIVGDDSSRLGSAELRKEAGKLAVVKPVSGKSLSRTGLVFSQLAPESVHDLLTKPDLLTLFDHPNLRYPSIFLTTADRRIPELAHRCLTYLDETVQKHVERCWPESSARSRDWPDLRKQLLELLERQLIVRRFDMEALPAATVFHVIQRNVLEANKLIYGIAYPPHQGPRRKKADRIRLVIDDLWVLCAVCPDLMTDGAFLPFLTFFLEREGITSLLVNTDSVRPDRRSEDPTSRALHSLLRRAILTWNVPFEGRKRIAISVFPTADENRGIVRELILREPVGILSGLESGSSVISGPLVPVATPRFELFSGIEHGAPKAVPLAVYFFAETKQFEAYIEEEDAIFREMFTSLEDANPVHPGRVVYGLDAKRYLAMRDYTHLPIDSQDAHTLVFQVDGYWALSGGSALSDQKGYLDKALSDDEILRRVEDPFGVFRGRPKSIDSSTDQTRPIPRRDYFRNKYYSLGKHDDRVPFMWDFGFILARSAPWESAAGAPIESMLKRPRADAKTNRILKAAIPFSHAPTKIGAVRRDLSRSSQEPGKYTSWRKFFGACRSVADLHHAQTGAPAIAFDISSPSAETVNALLLEIWFSEMTLEAGLCPSWAGDVNLAGANTGLSTLLGIKGHCGFGSLSEAFKNFKSKLDTPEKAQAFDLQKFDKRRRAFENLPFGAFCLYKAWLLLLEVLPFDEFLDPDNLFTFRQGHHASMHAMASRHWYKTACSYANEMYRSEGVHDAPEALSLPGNHSTRGDWFLGSPRSSRSPLLAHYAFDLLSSRRANITRLQHGLGLPTRDIVEDLASSLFRTALRCKSSEDRAVASEEKYLTEITYENLSRLGSTKETLTGEAWERFYWLWRTNITDYDRLSRPLQKWLTRVFRWTIEFRKRNARSWRGGFVGYDQLTCKLFSELYNYPSFEEFGSLCDLLMSELSAAKRVGTTG